MAKNNEQVTTKDDEPNKVTYTAMESAEKMNIYGPFENVEELMETLNATTSRPQADEHD